MKKVFGVLFLLTMLVGLLSLNSCSTISVDAGQEAVLVSQPVFFGSGQIFPTPVAPGLEWAAFSTDAYYYSTLPQKITEGFDNIMTKDNNPVDLNAHIVITNIAGKSPIIHKEFGKDYYKNKIQEEFRSEVRNKVSDFEMHVLTTQRKIVDSLQVVIKSDMAKYVTNLGIPAIVENVTIGKVTPPTEVLAQTVATAAQKQAELTYDAQTQAEAKRELSEKARAKADQAYANEMNMTVDQYLRSVELENQKAAIESNADVSFIYGIQAAYIK